MPHITHSQRTLLAASSLALCLCTAGCHKSEAQEAAKPSAVPDGEVWLTEQQVKDAQIEVQTIADHDVDDTILTSGTITLDDQRTGHVFSPVTGRVVRIVAGLGEKVAKGAPLAVIESPDIGNAVSDVHKAEADIIAAEHDLKRKKNLYEQKAGPAADVEAANDTYRRAKAELERARAKEVLLREGNADVVTQQYTLPSPIEGEILLRNINPGIEVQGQYSGGATQELFTVGELDKVWVLGDLYEMDFARVHVGDQATVNVIAYPSEFFKGKVDWVAGSLDPATRTAKVRCTFDNPEKKLRPNMYATVQVSVEQETTLAIPRDSVFRLGAEKIVFIETSDDGTTVKFKRVAIDVDEGEESQWLVVKKGTQSLQRGEKIVVNGGILLSQVST